jgi:hypothetical protein
MAEFEEGLSERCVAVDQSQFRTSQELRFFFAGVFARVAFFGSRPRPIFLAN